MARFFTLAAAVALAALGLAGAPGAQTGEMTAEQRAAALDLEFLKLRGAGDPSAASDSEQEIWRLWFIGPTEDATRRLAEAAQALQYGDFREAEALLDELVEAEPGFAEAWNQRAFARFLQFEFADSLRDIARTLELEPRHFGALAGRARIEARMGKPQAAQRTMGEVGRIHPWLARASAIPPDPPPPPPLEQRDL